MPWPTTVVLLAVVVLACISMASAWGLGVINGVKALGAVFTVAAITGWAGFLTSEVGGSSSESGGHGAAQQISVRAQDYSFSPPARTVKANQEVHLTLTNGANQIHNWSVQGLDQVYATGDVQGGKSGTVTFTPSKSGTFKVTCTIAGHESFGMVGQLIVQ